MGTLFSTPSVPTYSPVKYVAPISATTEEVAEMGGNQKSSDEGVVKDTVRRTLGGRNATIQTSYRGVLNQGNKLSPQRKTLLGE